MLVGWALVGVDVGVPNPVILTSGVPADVIVDEIKTLSLSPKAPAV